MRETTKREDKRKENAYNEWNHEMEATFHTKETHQDDFMETVGTSRTGENQSFIENNPIDNASDLSTLEAQSKEFFDILKESIAQEDERLTLPTLDVPASSSADASVLPASKHHHLSPAWLVAAVLLGFVIGFMMPRGGGLTSSDHPSALATDSSLCCRSLADGDVNTSLLVSL